MKLVLSIVIIAVCSLSACRTVRTGNTPHERTVGQLLGSTLLPDRKFQNANPEAVIKWIFEEAKKQPRTKQVDFVFDRIGADEAYVAPNGPVSYEVAYVAPNVSVSFEHSSILKAIDSVCRQTSWTTRITGSTFHVQNSSCAGM